ncbi:MAG: hypothetical protein C0467_00700 [Planctomycetaceae bacterium]|nr:hypothetical protein [Planctomycetaceae bacterium]
MNDPAHPVLLNTWKHHAGWIRWRIGQAVACGSAGVETLVPEMAIVGARLMDLYTGSFTPAQIAEHVIAHVRGANRLDFDSLSAWLQSQGEFSMIELLDGSHWTIRLGPADGRYLHLHPGRWVLHTIRVQANTLKSAVMAHAHALLTGEEPDNLATVNTARKRYLGLLPMRELTGESGLGAVIAALK